MGHVHFKAWIEQKSEFLLNKRKIPASWCLYWSIFLIKRKQYHIVKEYEYIPKEVIFSIKINIHYDIVYKNTFNDYEIQSVLTHYHNNYTQTVPFKCKIIAITNIQGHRFKPRYIVQAYIYYIIIITK